MTFTFLTDVFRQTINNLYRDDALFKWSTWTSCWKHLFARDGLLRGNLQAWKDYLRVDFHPLDHDASDSERWLEDNRKSYSEVSRPAQHRTAGEALSV
ncbi:MAG: hypothetical protein EB006_05765 [Betaproteobacteria bacterium]|nr:hypothetical protein [Betaproteobacteria bacterium]